MNAAYVTRAFCRRRARALAWSRVGAVLLTCAWVGAAIVQAQDAPPATSEPSQEPALTHRAADQPAAKPTVALTVPQGTPIQVALDKEVRVRKAGEPIRGRVIAPVYAFDKLVIPVGTEVTGEVAKIESISGGQRTLSALDADFTPTRKVQVAFNQINLPDGRQIPIHTIVTPGSGRVIEFVSARDEDQRKGAKDAAAEKAKEAKHQAKQEWDNAINQVKAPGKIHRLERFAVGELPAHPQYIDAGTVYFAELKEPLDFGAEPLTPQMASAIGATPVDGSVVEARLVTPLSSATAQKGDEVEAIVSRPLFDGDRLIVPQGSRLKGSVVEVHAAHRPGRNGELRLVFHDLLLPEGVEQKVEASMAGVEAAKAENVKLDSEGGAKATAPKTRFLTTGAAVGLGAASFLGDSFGETGPRAAGGAGGYKLIGIGLGLAIRSQPFGMAMGALGGSKAIYANFIARGRDVVFPKDTGMTVSIGTRQPADAPATQPTPSASDPAKPTGL